jgi:hypothetical protein
VAEIYRAILSLTFACPPTRCAISPEAADLITRALAPNPRQRLAGGPAIMAHPFFAGVDWVSHSNPGGSRDARLKEVQQQPTMQALEVMGRALHGNVHGLPPSMHHHAGTFRALEKGGTMVSGSQASAASTELGTVLSSLNPEDHASHLDNLVGLNDKVVSLSHSAQQQVR